jgi:hypothetical protein
LLEPSPLLSQKASREFWRKIKKIRSLI